MSPSWSTWWRSWTPFASETAIRCLDNTVVLYGSALKNGNGHTTQDLPILLAGRGGGKFSPGRRIMLPEETPIANLHLTLAQTMGIEADRFNNSTGTVAGL